MEMYTKKITIVAGRIATGLLSFIVPGFGQLIQGRPLKALGMFLMAAMMWLIFMGWIVHVWSMWDALMYSPDEHTSVQAPFRNSGEVRYLATHTSEPQWY